MIDANVTAFRCGPPAVDQQNSAGANAPALILVLMGLPAAGKSSCLDALGVDRSNGDMDCRVGGKAPPLETALA